MRRSWTVAAGEFLIWWALCLLLYVIFISAVSSLELAVGAGVAALAAVGARSVRTASGSRLGGRAHALGALLKWPGSVLADTGRLVLATVHGLSGTRRVHGRFHTVRLAPGTGPAWGAALLSATPGGYVVDVTAADGEAGPALLVHTLPGPPSALERALTTGGRA
ncbi:hypothetical protein ACWCXB_16725 [Streptomyces sp. NPDC001514]